MKYKIKNNELRIKLTDKNLCQLLYHLNVSDNDVEKNAKVYKLKYKLEPTMRVKDNISIGVNKKSTYMLFDELDKIAEERKLVLE